MNAAALVIAVIVLIVATMLGWHANRAYIAHSDVKTNHGRIAGYRKVRLRSGLIAIALVVAGLFLFGALGRH